MVSPVDWLGMLTTEPGLDRTLNFVTLCVHYYKSGPAFLVAILVAEKLYMVLGCLQQHCADSTNYKHTLKECI